MVHTTSETSPRRRGPFTAACFAVIAAATYHAAAEVTADDDSSQPGDHADGRDEDVCFEVGVDEEEVLVADVALDADVAVDLELEARRPTARHRDLVVPGTSWYPASRFTPTGRVRQRCMSDVAMERKT